MARTALPTRMLVVALCIAAAAAHGAAHENDLARFVPSALTTALQEGASVTLSASTASDGDFIIAAVSNSAPAARGDFISMYLADADPTTTVPLKWTYLVPYFPSYPTLGTANVTFQVYNVRAPVIFYLCKGKTSSPTIIAQSARLTFDASAPVRPRVLPGPAPGKYAIAWQTSAAAAAGAHPTLKWRVGGAPGAPLTSATPATAGFVARADLCGPPANGVGWMDLGATVTAQLSLAGAAGQTVYYAASDDAHAGEEHAFVVPALPSAGAEVFPFRFAAFGDLGRGSFDDGITWSEYGAASKNTSLWLSREQGLNFIQHFGDVRCACAHAGPARGALPLPPLPPPSPYALAHAPRAIHNTCSYAVGYLQTWDEMVWMSSQFAAQVPYLTSYGNHGAAAPSFSFRLPPPYFSFISPLPFPTQPM